MLTGTILDKAGAAAGQALDLTGMLDTFVQSLVIFKSAFFEVGGGVLVVYVPASFVMLLA